MPPDFGLKLLFPNDVEMRTNYRDAYTESRLLFFYGRSIKFSSIARSHDPQRWRFYGRLGEELLVDEWEVNREFEVLQEAIPLSALK